MAKFFKTRQARKRTALLLSVALATSLSLASFTACSTDGKEEEEETPVTKTDAQLIKNGDFEFYSESTKETLIEKFALINSPDNWTRSTGSDTNGSAPTSDAASGIINTAEWDYFTRPGYRFSSKEDALANWEKENVTAFDRIRFYEEHDVDSDEDFEYYSDYNYSIDWDDIKDFYDVEKNESLVANPGTHSEDTEGTSVLMIHNRKTTNSTVYGTAQYYTSSTTVTLTAGTAAELSVWVKTANLKHWANLEAKSGCGAYIGITNTVGGTTLDQMQVKNINTAVLNPNNENNGWVKYSFYVQANSYADSTIKVVLGLGFGSTADMYETVDGFAFFDDLTCKKISSAEYAQATATLDASYVCSVESTADEKKFVTQGMNETYALNLSTGKNGNAFDLTAANVETGLTKEVYNDRTYTTETYKGLNLSNAPENVAKVATLAEMRTSAASNKYLSSVLDDAFGEKYPFAQDEAVLMLMSVNGAPYTATVKSPSFTVAPDDYLLVSFFVKTSAMDGFTGAGISVVDGTTKTSLSNLDSTTLSTVDIDEETKDIYDGWARCFFFLSNDTEENKTFHLEFTYGSTSIVGTTLADYTDGYAAFANFRTTSLTKQENSFAPSNTTSKSVALSAESSSDKKFDDAVHNNPDSIETGLAKPANYWGVQANDKRVGGDVDSELSVPPAGTYAGLANAKHVGTYETSEWYLALCSVAQQKGVIASTVNAWEALFGTAQQPMIILNTEEGAYGYIATATANLASSSATTVSVRVKVSQGAIAKVYLIDATDMENGYVAGLKPQLTKLTYWYNDDGDVCTIDPESDDYDRKTCVAYYKEANGLFSNSLDKTDGKLYANLANYLTDDENNLTTEEGTIAFYYNDGKYYAYCNDGVYSTEVTDFDHKYARYDYTNATAPEAVITVDGNDANVADKWITVCFNVQTGSEAKDYRLEVWSGSRDGSVVNPANSYVFFDDVQTSSSSSYADLLADAVSAMEKQQGVKPGEKLTENAYYYAYTFYDDANYLRYDETLDEDQTGDPYGSYTQSAYSEGLVYLYYEDKLTSSTEYYYQMFLDYSETDVTVARDLPETDDDDDADTDTPAASAGDVFLYASTIALVAALVIVIIAIIIQRAVKAHRRKNGITVKSSVKTVRTKAAKQPKAEEAPKPVAPKDENDPYNE